MKAPNRTLIVCSIKPIEEFLSVKISDALLQKNVHFVNIKEMTIDEGIMYEPKAKPGAFVRSGQCGEWKKYFTVEQNEWFDKTCKKLYEGLDIDIIL